MIDIYQCRFSDFLCVLREVYKFPLQSFCSFMKSREKKFLISRGLSFLFSEVHAISCLPFHSKVNEFIGTLKLWELSRLGF